MKQLILPAMVGLFITACTFRSSSTKNPVIANQEELETSLNSLVESEGFDVSGIHTNENGLETTTAELIVYNAKGLEKGVFAKKKTARKLAKAFYDGLQNKKDYNHISVTFIFRDGHYTEQQRLNFTPKELR